MNKLFITSLSAIVLATGITAALAHQTGPGSQGNGSWGHMGQGWMGGQAPGQQGGGYWGHPGQGWMGRQGPGWNMMGYGMMGYGMMDPDMMLVMLDTNGDGTLSLEEFQAMPTRMFNYLDTNHDGKVTKDELDAFHADHDGDSNQ